MFLVTTIIFSLVLKQEKRAFSALGLTAVALPVNPVGSSESLACSMLPVKFSRKSFTDSLLRHCLHGRRVALLEGAPS